MIRSVHNLACAVLGALLVITVVGFQEHWTWVPLAVLVPWDKAAHWSWEVFGELHKAWEEKKSRRAFVVEQEILERSGR